MSQAISQEILETPSSPEDYSQNPLSPGDMNILYPQIIETSPAISVGNSYDFPRMSVPIESLHRVKETEESKSHMRSKRTARMRCSPLPSQTLINEDPEEEIEMPSQVMPPTPPNSDDEKENEDEEAFSLFKELRAQHHHFAYDGTLINNHGNSKEYIKFEERLHNFISDYRPEFQRLSVYQGVFEQYRTELEEGGYFKQLRDNCIEWVERFNREKDFQTIMSLPRVRNFPSLKHFLNAVLIDLKWKKAGIQYAVFAHFEKKYFQNHNIK